MGFILFLLKQPSPMRRTFSTYSIKNRSWTRVISIIGLLATVVPSILVFAGTTEFETHKIIMLIGMLFWLITAPFWMGRKEG